MGMCENGSVAFNLGAMGDLSDRCAIHHAECNTLLGRNNPTSRTRNKNDTETLAAISKALERAGDEFANGVDGAHRDVKPRTR
jgi:hypothetical protein